MRDERKEYVTSIKQVDFNLLKEYFIGDKKLYIYDEGDDWFYIYTDKEPIKFSGSNF